MNANQHSNYLATILNSVDCAILVVNLSGKIIDCNQAVNKVFDYSCEEIKNKSIYDLCSLTSEILTEHKKKLIANGTKRDNTQFYCEISVHPLKINNNKKFLFVVADVDERETNRAIVQEAIRLTSQNLKTFMGE